MGAKYTTQTQSGYDASPPPDDGSVAAANKVRWSFVKTKIGDPVLALAQAINSALVTFTNFGSRAVTGTDSVAAGDHMKTIEASGTFTESLPDAATVGAGFIASVKNTGSGTITVALTTGANTLDGTVGGSMQLKAGWSAQYKTNAGATGYNTIALSPWAVSSAGAVSTSGATTVGSLATGGAISTTLTTDSTSPSTGPIHSDGGMSCSKAFYAGGGVFAQMSGVTNAVRLGQTSDATTYGQLSFNGVYTSTGLLGIYAGGGVDTVAYYNVPTGGGHKHRVNGSDISTTYVAGVALGTVAQRSNTEPTNAISLYNGTAPVGTLTNGATFYAASGEMRVMDAAGNSTLLSPHDSDRNWIHHCQKGDGKEVLYRVEEFFDFLNEKYGADFKAATGKAFVEEYEMKLAEKQVEEAVGVLFVDGEGKQSIEIKQVVKTVQVWERQ